MTRSTFDVRVWTTHTVSRSHTKSYKVRWSVDGRQRSKTLKTAKLADSFRSTLLAAVRSGEAFDLMSGLPLSVTPIPSGPSWLSHAQSLVDAKWNEASPRHRQSTAEALTTITMALHRDGATYADPAGARKALRCWSFNASARRQNREPPEEFAQALSWLYEHSRPLKDLEDVDLLRSVLIAIATNLDGTPASTSTINRKRAALSSALVYALERGDLDSNPSSASSPDGDPTQTRSTRASLSAPLRPGCCSPRSPDSPPPYTRSLPASTSRVSARPRRRICDESTSSFLEPAGVRSSCSAPTSPLDPNGPTMAEPAKNAP